jgi:phospholipid/cholesterol/gamma-HCH transport system permease protein
MSTRPWRQRQVPGLELAGGITRFGWRGMRGMPTATRYFGEVLRQMALLATGSTVVIIVACCLVGQSCGLEAAYLSRAISTPALAAGATFGCAVLYIVPFLFGFVLAAKVGCGFVAEIGAMRVSDEVDALEVMGVDSMVFIVSARMLASTLLLPVVYLLGITAADFGGYIQAGLRFNDVSPGTYEVYRYAFFGPTDILLSLAQGLVISTVVVSVALYYGYTVRGGPVEVGVATAKSMTVNLVLVTWVNLVFVVLFLLKGRIPIA